MLVWYLAIVALFIMNVVTWTMHLEPPALTELKRRYWATLDVLRTTGDPLWTPVLRPAIITGMTGWTKAQGPIGSNVNKGYEIYICLDGDDVNSAMYVLMHELAHMSVPEYDHTSQFWTNFNKLKAICIANGLYEAKGTRQYCGDSIKE